MEEGTGSADTLVIHHSLFVATVRSGVVWPCVHTSASSSSRSVPKKTLQLLPGKKWIDFQENPHLIKPDWMMKHKPALTKMWTPEDINIQKRSKHPPDFFAGIHCPLVTNESIMFFESFADGPRWFEQLR
ncbi:hypothetical protein F2P81_012620 [Scophthalmus maximus]|uniref:Uncharacterized protein n=1 Tax=Scophthalmus maximus TaxID=52904 RepID=A0A6A4SXW3_SCOMX|nr:hypothetical protein F2P81_012620 [Scophthalmus maximus]